MIAIISLLITLTLSLLVTRIATMALMLTGVSKEVARFQARSAFTGAGFTSKETEMMVNHPVRRRIIHILMLLGNVGVATVVATMMLSVLDTSQSNTWGASLLLLLSGLMMLWFFSSSRIVERQLNKVISWALRKITKLEVRDYVAVLNLQDGYAVTETKINPKDWLANKTIIELKLPKEGVLILGIQLESGDYIGAPTAETVVSPGDTLVLYGPIKRLEELDQRRSGWLGHKAHKEAISDHEEVLDEQQSIIESVIIDLDSLDIDPKN